MNFFSIADHHSIEKYRQAEISTTLCGQKPFGSRHWEYPWVYEQSGIEFQTGLKILDIAPDFTFPFSQHLKKNNHSVVYIDLEKRNWSESISWGIDPKESDSEIQIMDVREMDFMDSTFDVIFCISVLEHIVCPTQDPKDPNLPKLFDPGGAVPAIKEMRRCLKPGGKLLLTVDIYGGKLWEPFFKQWDIFFDLEVSGFYVPDGAGFSRLLSFSDPGTFLSQFHGPYITLGFNLTK